MDDVVAATPPQQVQEDPHAEYERRQDATSPARRIQPHAGSSGHDPDALVEINLRAAIPLAQRDVGDLMPLAGQPLGEIAVPALSPSDGVGKQAVIDETYTHSGSIIARIGVRLSAPARVITA